MFCGKKSLFSIVSGKGCLVKLRRLTGVKKISIDFFISGDISNHVDSKQHGKRWDDMAHYPETLICLGSLDIQCLLFNGKYQSKSIMHGAVIQVTQTKFLTLKKH